MPVEQHYLSGLDLSGRRVVVIGGGSVAQRRLPRLIAAGAVVELIAPETTPSVGALADTGEIRWRQRGYRDGDLAEGWYAIACTDDPEINAAVCAEAERQRVFCVRADAGQHGSAVTASVGEYEGLLVGVLSGGSHTRSARVRDSVLESMRSGTIDVTADSAAPGRNPGVALVGGGPGDPELITVKGRRLLAGADVVITDRLVPRELLDELPAGVEVVDAAKIPHGRAASQDVINDMLLERVRAGQFVVRLKGGDPYVFGRGFEEFIHCADAGVPVTVVPGISSAFGAPSAADVPVTHRGMTHEAVVVSGHVPPSHPDSLVDWQALGRLRGTLILMMGVGNLAEFAEVLLEAGRDPATPVAVITDGTTRNQRVVRSTLHDVTRDAAAAEVTPPAITVIGPVAELAQRTAVRHGSSA